MSTLVEKQVVASADDGYITSEAGFDNSGNDVYIGDSGGIKYHAFYRFTGVTIPQSSTIDVCYITVCEHASAATALTKLRFEKANNPAAPTDAADYNGRTLTTAGVDWDGDPGGEEDWCNSPSLVIPMQELVDAYDLDDDAVQVFHKDDSSPANGFQRFYVYDVGSAFAPYLYVEYTPAGGGAPIWVVSKAKKLQVMGVM
jgi:hypothetical protein